MPQFVEREEEQDDGAAEREAEERDAAKRAEQEAKEARERKEKEQRTRAWLLLLRQSRGANTRRGAIVRNTSVRSVKDGRRSARKRKPRRKLGERNERRPRQRHIRPSRRLKDASPMRDVRAIVPHLWFHFHILL